MLLCATAMLGACSTPDSPRPLGEITGTASYRERMMLPPGAELEVVLEDVSRADAPAQELVRIVQPARTAPPYPFTIMYDPSAIVANHHYNLRAKITADGAVMFRSDTGTPVLGPDNVLHADIVLRRASDNSDGAAPPTSQLRGMYSYMADAGWFTDCRSGTRMPVAQEADNAALERAYSNGKSMDGAPMLATVEGRVEERLPMEGDQKRPTLIVDKFISVEAQGCSGPPSTAHLENTYWKLMTLDGDSVETPEGAREIQFVLTSENHRVTGFSGCNSMMGAYQVENDRIVFSNMGGTMMACANTMEIERRVHQMFSNVAAWKISGETLQLSDANGKAVATFESRYMK